MQEQLSTLKKWIIDKTFFHENVGICKVSISEDPQDSYYTILKLREEDFKEEGFDEFTTGFKNNNLTWNKIRLKSGTEEFNFYIVKDYYNMYVHVCHKKGEANTRWTIDEIKEITTTERKFKFDGFNTGFKDIERIIGYDIILMQSIENSEECGNIMMSNFKF